MAGEEKKKAGRKGKYETHVLPFFEQIEKYLNDGASEKQIAECLDVSYAAWNKYKVDYPEFGELCRKPRIELVKNLRSALIKKALGFEYEEKKTYYRKPRGADDSEIEYIYSEVYKKQSLPNETAIFGALNIYDPEYVKDKKAHELKKQELEFKKLQAELKDF